ncbi:unnamed protein product [Prorocentrum cordatum]|uniref:Uncharacterized protein n=1 Tax=Prorocentrum cordatum TaxID=2364126 RepID=A0ABN9UX84_9DINO|nr:unnamed protein product [Polarella glacialis]
MRRPTAAQVSVIKRVHDVDYAGALQELLGRKDLYSNMGEATARRDYDADMLNVLRWPPGERPRQLRDVAPRHVSETLGNFDSERRSAQVNQLHRLPPRTVLAPGGVFGSIKLPDAVDASPADLPDFDGCCDSPCVGSADLLDGFYQFADPSWGSWMRFDIEAAADELGLDSIDDEKLGRRAAVDGDHAIWPCFAAAPMGRGRELWICHEVLVDAMDAAGLPGDGRRLGEARAATLVGQAVARAPCVDDGNLVSLSAPALDARREKPTAELSGCGPRWRTAKRAWRLYLALHHVLREPWLARWHLRRIVGHLARHFSAARPGLSALGAFYTFIGGGDLVHLCRVTSEVAFATDSSVRGCTVCEARLEPWEVLAAARWRGRQQRAPAAVEVAPGDELCEGRAAGFGDLPDPPIEPPLRLRRAVAERRRVELEIGALPEPLAKALLGASCWVERRRVARRRPGRIRALEARAAVAPLWHAPGIHHVANHGGRAADRGEFLAGRYRGRGALSLSAPAERGRQTPACPPAASSATPLPAAALENAGHPEFISRANMDTLGHLEILSGACVDIATWWAPVGGDREPSHADRALVAFTVCVLWLCRAAGVLVAFENPPASRVWRWPAPEQELRSLLWPKVLFDSCRFGAPFKKPGAIAGGLPALSGLSLRHRVELRAPPQGGAAGQGQAPGARPDVARDVGRKEPTCPAGAACCALGSLGDQAGPRRSTRAREGADAAARPRAGWAPWRLRAITPAAFRPGRGARPRWRPRATPGAAALEATAEQLGRAALRLAIVDSDAPAMVDLTDSAQRRDRTDRVRRHAQFVLRGPLYLARNAECGLCEFVGTPRDRLGFEPEHFFGSRTSGCSADIAVGVAPPGESKHAKNKTLIALRRQVLTCPSVARFPRSYLGPLQKLLLLVGHEALTYWLLRPPEPPTPICLPCEFRCPALKEPRPTAPTAAKEAGPQWSSLLQAFTAGGMAIAPRAVVDSEFWKILMPGSQLLVWYGDDNVWHERLAVWPVQGAQWVLQTPDKDVYAEYLDGSDPDGLERAIPLLVSSAVLQFHAADAVLAAMCHRAWRGLTALAWADPWGGLAGALAGAAALGGQRPAGSWARRPDAGQRAGGLVGRLAGGCWYKRGLGSREGFRGEVQRGEGLRGAMQMPGAAAPTSLTGPARPGWLCQKALQEAECMEVKLAADPCGSHSEAVSTAVSSTPTCPFRAGADATATIDFVDDFATIEEDPPAVVGEMARRGCPEEDPPATVGEMARWRTRRSRKEAGRKALVAIFWRSHHLSHEHSVLCSSDCMR